MIQKITKEDKETIDKRAKEVPESDKTVCRETELVRGHGAQVRPTAARALPFACFRHSSCVTLFSQVRLVHLIFAVPVPQIQKQIVGCL